MHILYHANCKERWIVGEWLWTILIKTCFAPVPLFREKIPGMAFDSCSQFFILLPLQAPDFLFTTFCLRELLPIPLHFNLLPSASFWDGSICLRNYKKTRGKGVRIMSVGLPSSSISTPYIPKMLLTTLMWTCMYLLAYSWLHIAHTDSAMGIKDLWAGS